MQKSCWIKAVKARLQPFEHCHYDLNSGLNNSDEERSSTDGEHRQKSGAKVSLRGHIVFQFHENQAFFALLLFRSATPMFRVALKLFLSHWKFFLLEILPVAGPRRPSVGSSSLAVFQMRQNTGQVKLVEVPVVFHQHVSFKAQPSQGSGKPFSLTCLGSCEILSLCSHKDVFC